MSKPIKKDTLVISLVYQEGLGLPELVIVDTYLIL